MSEHSCAAAASVSAESHWDAGNAHCQEHMMRNLEEDELSFTLGSYKPRGALAKALYQRHLADNCLANIDKNQWYQCNLHNVPEDVSGRFLQLSYDHDTQKFLDQAEEKSNWIFTQIWHSVVTSFLGWFMTQTSINGWLRRGSMFVVSRIQFLQLLGERDYWRGDALLDLGAGDGTVTACLAPLFQQTYVTEVSGTMQTLLQQRGYKLMDINEWSTSRKYDVISCLNLLDRCDRPLQLLREIRDALNPGGKLFIALVLPFSPYVESGTKDHRPNESLPIVGATFEEQVTSVVRNVFQPLGFELLRWSRVPYLCEGDLNQSFYWLDDAVLTFKVKDMNSY